MADIDLFVALLWARKLDIFLPARLARLFERVQALPSTMMAMAHEGIERVQPQRETALAG